MPPITKVNRQIRYEAIPVLYGPAELIIYFDSQTELEVCKKWLSLVDPWALCHMREYVLADFLHHCPDQKRPVHTGEETTIHRAGGVTQEYTAEIPGCCLHVATEMAERMSKIKSCVEVSEWGFSSTKENLLKLVELIDQPKAVS